MASASRSLPNDDGGSAPNCCRHSWRSSDRESRSKSPRLQSDRRRAGIGHSCCPMHAHIHPKRQSATAARRPTSSFRLLDARRQTETPPAITSELSTGLAAHAALLVEFAEMVQTDLTRPRRCGEYARHQKAKERNFFHCAPPFDFRQGLPPTRWDSTLGKFASQDYVIIDL